MTTLLSRRAYAVIAVISVIALSTVLSNTLIATRACCEGDRWLRWSSDTREAYVFAYVLGYSNGFARGCTQAIEAESHSLEGNVKGDAAHACRQKAPDFSKGPTYFAKSITDFYGRYPEDRDIYIDELIQSFAHGLGVEEAHRQHYPSRDKSVSPTKQ
jgi:hypothetical protein